jgi:hypothetical protein
VDDALFVSVSEFTPSLDVFGERHAISGTDTGADLEQN